MLGATANSAAPFAALVAPPVAGQNNKILWVPRVASPVGTPLQIRATLTATGTTAAAAPHHAALAPFRSPEECADPACPGTRGF